MIDQFLEWFFDCLLDLGEWFLDTLCRACSLLLDIIAWFIVIILIILLSPIWIPFLFFWLLFVRDKEVESDTDKR